jgi:hypothetical protein
MSTAERVDTNTFGREVANGTTVRLFQSALSKSETNVNGVWKILRNLDADDAWRRFRLPEEDGQTLYTYTAADFRRFLEGPRPKGCETPIDLLRKMVRDTPAWPIFEKLIRGEPGNPTGANQYTSGKNDNITLSSDLDEPAVLPLTKKAPTGTSVNYALSRLEKNKPELYAEVIAGKISPNAAMVKAGYREKAITIPAVPAIAARRLAKHFDVRELIAELSRYIHD